MIFWINPQEKIETMPAPKQLSYRCVRSLQSTQMKNPVERNRPDLYSIFSPENEINVVNLPAKIRE